MTDDERRAEFLAWCSKPIQYPGGEPEFFPVSQMGPDGKRKKKYQRQHGESHERKPEML